MKNLLPLCLLASSCCFSTAFVPRSTTSSIQLSQRMSVRNTVGVRRPRTTASHIFSSKPKDRTTVERNEARPGSPFNIPFRTAAAETNDESIPLLQVQQTSQELQQSSSSDDGSLDVGALLGVSALTILGVSGITAWNYFDLNFDIVSHFLEVLVSNPQGTLQDVVDSVKNMGPQGLAVFGVIYLVAELLAVPATPLTLSAGYLFGLTQGVAVVLCAATIAASVGFFVGQTLLRSWVEEQLAENPKLAKLDSAIGKEGFKLLLLVRLSPIFPFSLSNYLYGASSIDFVSYFWATLLGFTPGTIGYVYTGMVGQALTLNGGESAEPWYVYAGGLAALGVFLKLVSDVATNFIEALDEEESDETTPLV